MSGGPRMACYVEWYLIKLFVNTKNISTAVCSTASWEISTLKCAEFRSKICSCVLDKKHQKNGTYSAIEYKLQESYKNVSEKGNCCDVACAEFWTEQPKLRV